MKPSDLIKVLEIGIPFKRSFIIVGKPGIGKSEVMKQACEKIKCNYIIFHPVISGPEVFSGFPWIITDNNEPKAERIPFGHLRKLLTADTLTAAIFEDFGQAAPLTQAACMQLFLERCLDDKKVSDQITFLIATNAKEHMAAVSGILEPVKSRFSSIINLEVDIENWIEWATKNNVPPIWRAFIRHFPQFLDQFEPTREMTNSPTPRTIYNASMLYTDGYPKELMFELTKGAAGEIIATEFLGYERMFSKLKDPRLIIKDPMNYTIPSDPGILYALATSIPIYTTLNNISNVLIFTQRLMDPDTFEDNIARTEFAIVLLKNCEYQNPEIMETRDWIEFQIKYKEVFLGKI